MSCATIMGSGRQGFDTSVWQKSFTKRCGLKGNLDKLFVETQRRDFHVDDMRTSEFRIFFKDSLVSRLEFRALEEQFQGFNLDDLNRGVGARTAGWIDERSFTDETCPGIARTNGQGDLTAQELRDKLKQPVRSSYLQPQTYLTPHE
jgi:hypothetical protein